MMEQSDIDELLTFILANGNTAKARIGLMAAITIACQQVSEKCARIVERQCVSTVNDAFAKHAPVLTVAEMNSILHEVAEEIRLAGWK